MKYVINFTYTDKDKDSLKQEFDLMANSKQEAIKNAWDNANNFEGVIDIEDMIIECVENKEKFDFNTILEELSKIQKHK